MKKTEFEVEEIFGEISDKANITPEQITKLNNFSAKIM